MCLTMISFNDISVTVSLTRFGDISPLWQNLKVFGNFVRDYFVFGKILNLLREDFFKSCQANVHFKIGQIWRKQYSHLVTLVTVVVCVGGVCERHSRKEKNMPDFNNIKFKSVECIIRRYFIGFICLPTRGRHKGFLVQNKLADHV